MMIKIGDRVILTGNKNIESKPINFGRKGLVVNIVETSQDNYWFRVKWDDESPSWVGNCLEVDIQWIRDNKLNEIGI